MSDQPKNTGEAPIYSLDSVDENGYSLLTFTAQRAVLPRQLEEGVYSVIDADGSIKIVETAGYKQQREFDWDQKRSDEPEFVHRAVTVLDVNSFIDYLRCNTASRTDESAGDCARDDFREAGWDGHTGELVDSKTYRLGSGELELWGSVDDRQIKAILDGHNGLRKHTATLSLSVSREWAEWAGIDGKLLNQVDFAEFIADHISTIGAPDGGQLVDICETLTGTVGVQWKSGQLDATGQRKFQFEETIDGQAGVRGDLTIPTELTLVLRPFQGSEPIAVKARFRFRLNGGAVQMGVRLVEPDRVLEDAFDAIRDEVQGRVPVHVRIGKG